MAERFAPRRPADRAWARSPGARSDARHVAVEFVHPVIVGKRALPAIALADRDAVAALGDLRDGPRTSSSPSAPTRPTRTPRRRWRSPAGAGCLTIALGSRRPGTRPGDDPFVRQELAETLYHVLWELVHVFFEHRGLLEGREAREGHDSGASAFLYPFLAEQEHDLEAVVEDVRASVLMKAGEIAALRAQTLRRQRRGPGGRGGRDPGARFDGGGTLLALGNGGSATDAHGRGRRPAGRAPGVAARGAALDLAEDPAIITAIANDVGVEAIFARQVIAYGRRGRRRARALDQRQLGQRHRRPRRGAPARADRPWRWSATTAAGSRPRGSPTTSW